jgi:hypothetical protein
MKTFDNGGKQIGRIDQSFSKDKSVTVHELRNITTITVRDRRHREGNDRDPHRAVAFRH